VDSLFEVCTRTGVRAQPWTPNLQVTELYTLVQPRYDNGLFYCATAIGVTGTSEPDWPTSGTVYDGSQATGGVTWTTVATSAGFANVGDLVDLNYFVCTTCGEQIAFEMPTSPKNSTELIINVTAYAASTQVGASWRDRRVMYVTDRYGNPTVVGPELTGAAPDVPSSGEGAGYTISLSTDGNNTAGYTYVLSVQTNQTHDVAFKIKVDFIQTAAT
jgi:hypothetical protein